MKQVLWHFRALGKIRVARKLVKGGFKFFYRHGRVYTIRNGPIRGLRWYFHRDHQFWMPLGQYEPETAAWLKETIEPNMIFFDIGANAGYFTLLGSTLVGPGGQVVSFEPIPSNVDTIQRHLQINKISHAVVEPLALADKKGQTTFVWEENNANSHLQEIALAHAESRPKKCISVELETIDNYVSRTGVKPNVIKVDVEGAEEKVLRGATQTLSSIRPCWIISTHSANLKRCCESILLEKGYTLSELTGFEHEILARPEP